MSQSNILMSQCNNLRSQCNILIWQCNNLMSHCNIWYKILAEGLLASIASIAGCYIVTMTKKKRKWKIYFLCNVCFKYWLKVFISSIIQIDNLYKIGNQLSKNKKLVIALHFDTFNKTFAFWLPNAYIPIWACCFSDFSLIHFYFNKIMFIHYNLLSN